MGQVKTQLHSKMPFAQKKETELHIIDGLHSHDSTMKLTALVINKMIINKTWDPGMLVITHTL